LLRDTARAMSEENVEIVRRVIEEFQAALARGEPEIVFDSELVAPDCEWIPFAGFPGPAMYRGKDGFADFMRVWTEDFEDWSVRIERLADAGGNRVVALLHQSAIGKGSGVPVELHFGQVSELKDGQVIRFRNILEPAEALEAAGLSE
jgi:ketosteroid isomerase-like protein